MKQSFTILALLALFFLLIGGCSPQQNKDAMANKQNLAGQEYNPVINPSDFTAAITNKYFSLPVGKKMIYELETGEGLERTEIQVLDKKKTIMGVDAVLYWDRVWLDNVLIEETKDYLAQDKEGNVWYFGEEVDNYKNGKFVNHDGTWIAGVDGAKPGIWVKSKPRVGDTYRQEYYKGKAEDMETIVAVGETVSTKLANYTDCVKVYDWTPLDPDSKEHKYYCHGVASMVLSSHIAKNDREELIEVTV